MKDSSRRKWSSRKGEKGMILVDFETAMAIGIVAPTILYIVVWWFDYRYSQR